MYCKLLLNYKRKNKFPKQIIVFFPLGCLSSEEGSRESVKERERELNLLRGWCYKYERDLFH